MQIYKSFIISQNVYHKMWNQMDLCDGEPLFKVKRDSLRSGYPSFLSLQ